MTTEDINTTINKIKDEDDESAHMLEDALQRRFIEYVASLEIPDLSEKAKLVLTTENINFSRWYS